MDKWSNHGTTKFRMNPVANNKSTIRWKFENIDTMTLDEYRHSNVFTTNDGFKWQIELKLFKKDTHRKNFAGVYLSAENANSSWLYQIHQELKIFYENEQLLYDSGGFDLIYTTNKKSWGKHIGWSEFRNNKTIIVVIDFNYKIYDFSNNPSIFSNLALRVEKEVFHFSKGLLCSCSKYFNSELANKIENFIFIKDVKPDDFIILLAALLPDPISITVRTYEILLHLSKKFEIDLLKNKCMNYFKEKRGETILKYISQAEKTDDGSILIPKVLNSVKHGIELKVLMESDTFKDFENITKVHFLNAASKFIT